MAADKTILQRGSAVLAAATGYKFNLTGDVSREIELLHHGDSASPITFQIATTEAGLASFATLADERQVLASGERLSVRVPTKQASIVDAGVPGLWVRVISAGTPTITIDGAI